MFQRYVFRPILLGLGSFRLHQLRSLLTVLGVVFGVASVIVMLAVGEGARTEAVRAIEQLGATNIFIRSVKPARSASSSGSFGALRYGLSFADLQRIQATFPEPARVAPTRDHRRDVWRGEHSLASRVVGVTPEYRLLHAVRIEAGRFIEPLDILENHPVAVLGHQAARTLFPLANPLGQSVRVGEDRYLHVVGVMEPRASSPGLDAGLPPEDFGQDIYIPFSTDRSLFGETVNFDRSGSSLPEKLDISQLVLSVPETSQVTSAARVVQSILSAAGKEDETVLTVPLDLLRQAERTQRVFTWVLAAIASISLVVGGIGIMNIMLATVTERTREIGIRRALGAYRLDIISQFIVETTTLSASGGILGIVLGVAGAQLATRLVGIQAIVELWSPALAFGISLLVGMVFGIYPAYRAARMNPVEALRNE